MRSPGSIAFQSAPKGRHWPPSSRWKTCGVRSSSPLKALRRLACASIAQRQHHPKPRPSQPRTEQHRPAAGDHWSYAVIPLHPQPGLRQPRPRAAPMLDPPPPLRLSDRPPRRALRTQVAHRHQRLVSLIGPNPPLRPLDELLDLLSEPIDHRPPPPSDRQPATRRIPGTHPMRDRLVITTSELRRPTQRARRIKRLQDLHDFLRLLQARLPGAASITRQPGLQATQDRTVAGKTDGHPWGDPVATTGDFRRPPTGRISWPLTLSSVRASAARARRRPGGHSV